MLVIENGRSSAPIRPWFWVRGFGISIWEVAFQLVGSKNRMLFDFISGACCWIVWLSAEESNFNLATCVASFCCSWRITWSAMFVSTMNGDKEALRSKKKADLSSAMVDSSRSRFGSSSLSTSSMRLKDSCAGSFKGVVVWPISPSLTSSDVFLSNLETFLIWTLEF